MPPPISIPLAQRAAIQELAKLSDAAYTAFRACLSEGPVYSEVGALIEHTSRTVAIHTNLGGQIVAALIGLRGFMDSSNMSVTDVGMGVADDAKAKGYVSAEQTGLLSTRIIELLDIKSLALTAKAFSLITSDAAPFSDARIVSDIRPIFSGKDESLELMASVIVHHLHIEVAGEGENHHSALTTSDLMTLRRTVERALDKDRKLREALRGGPLPALEAVTGSTDKESNG